MDDTNAAMLDTVKLNSELSQNNTRENADSTSDSPKSLENQLISWLSTHAQEDPQMARPILEILQASQVQDREPERAQDLMASAISSMQEYNSTHEPSHQKLSLYELPFMEIPRAHELGISHVTQSYDGKPPYFTNWGVGDNSVKFQPGRVLVVTTVEGVQETVKWASRKGKSVRVAGFRHTWSELYGKTGDIIIQFLPWSTTTDLPYRDPPKDFKSKLIGITIVDNVAGRVAPNGHLFCRVMAGTTNGQFRKWCFSQKQGCLPLNVIMLEVTFGGTNAPICHGSGFSTSTLSDLVKEVEYVDHHENLQTVNDLEELKVASGAFGLLGIVVSLTLQLEAMQVTEMRSLKRSLPLAIAPPKNMQLPSAVLKIISDEDISEEMLEEARADFIKCCEEDFYLEWFWFPYHSEVWINTWKSDS